MASPIYHPKPDDDGNLVRLCRPSKPSPLASWNKADEVASVIPGGEMPDSLNGIPFVDWRDAPSFPQEWNNVSGQAPIDEPPFCPSLEKAEAAGVVIEEADGRIWLVGPSNRFGGYTATFPKGRVEKGSNRQSTAIREAYEEAGLQVEITGFLADSERSQTYTRYYRARRLGGDPASMGWESQAVHLVPKEKLANFLTNKNDFPLLKVIAENLAEGTGSRQIVRSYGGNLARIREAIRSFRHRFGHWPTTLTLGRGTLNSLHEHLTPHGYAMLAKRMRILGQGKHYLILASDENGNQFDYGTEEPAWRDERVSIRDVDLWIWGVILC